MQQVLRATIKGGAGDDVRARTHQRSNRQVQRRLAAGRGNRADTAFQRCNTLLQHRIGRVAQARVHMAGALQVEKAGGVVARFKDKRGGEVNRYGARACRWVGCGARVQRQRVKSRG